MRNPMAVSDYAKFCAPTVLAALMDCTNMEAAQYLHDIGGNTGNGGTDKDVWDNLLQALGGEMHQPVDPKGTARYEEAWDRYLKYATRRRPSPRIKSYTVAQFLARYSGAQKGTWVLWTTSHTLLAHNGQVIVDSVRTKSQRARVYKAYRFPEGTLTPSQVRRYRKDLEGRHEHHKSNLRRRRNTRKRQQAVLEEFFNGLLPR